MKKQKAEANKRANREAAIWNNGAEWIVAFIERLAANESAHGSKWTTNMLSYYNKRYAKHAKNAPVMSVMALGRFTKRINKANKVASERLGD